VILSGRGCAKLLIKLVIFVAVTFAMFFSLWKSSVGLLLPLACLWTYDWYTGFQQIPVMALIIISVIHILVQVTAWWLSRMYRDGNLAFTGMGTTGFTTGIMASLFFGALLGFFAWWGLIGRLITEPLSIGPRPIIKSFLGGSIKVFYAFIMSGVISQIIF